MFFFIIEYFLSLQIVGLDQFMTHPHHLGYLNNIHADILICAINTLLQMYPILSKKPINIFFEVNLSHDLAVYVERKNKSILQFNDKKSNRYKMGETT